MYLSIMEIQKFTDALSVLLEVEQPWVLTKIDIQPKNKVIDVFIDFKKAFDTVDADLLLHKLIHYGFDNMSLNLIKDKIQ